MKVSIKYFASLLLVILVAAFMNGAVADNTKTNQNVSAPVNPYGGEPGGGITLPAYFKPTKYINNNNFYHPGTEDLGPDEMRISFVGSTPWPPRRDQAGTCIMDESGQSLL